MLDDNKGISNAVRHTCPTRYTKSDYFIWRPVTQLLKLYSAFFIDAEAESHNDNYIHNKQFSLKIYALKI